MPDEDYEAVLCGFVSELKQAWHAAGTPSYGQLERVSEHLRARRG